MNAEIKVGDIGSVYRVPTFDYDTNLQNFNPSSASVKQLIFRMPGADGLCVRTATAAQVTIDGVATWCLTYTVTEADVDEYVDEDEGGFHQQAGKIKIEAYVEFSNSQKWSSGIVTKDYLGRPLEVVARLTAA